MTTHTPVLLKEMLEALRPHDGGIYLDGTFGGGGYTTAILEAAKCRVIALDRDPDAAVRAEDFKKKYGALFYFLQGSFSDLRALFQASFSGRSAALDGAVFDFGVSSYQIDEPDRGFSFRFDGPLDMRMSKTGLTAAEVVNTWPEKKIADCLYQLGQERKSRRIAQAICQQRLVKPFESTLELANLIASTIGGRPDAQHPATLTFQALRILVNNELEEIESALSFSEDFLKPGGHLVTVSFHSLEDQIVKTFIRQRSSRTKKSSRLLPGEIPSADPTFLDLFPKGIAPSVSEIKQNGRARSARLRVAEKIQKIPAAPSQKEVAHA